MHETPSTLALEWWESRHHFLQEGRGLLEYRTHRAPLAGLQIDFPNVRFESGATVLGPPGALVLPLLTEDILADPRTVAQLYSGVAQCSEQGVAVLAATPLTENDLSGAASSTAEPWELDVEALVARADLAHLLETLCVARRHDTNGGALYLTPIEARLARALNQASIPFQPQVPIGRYRADFLVRGQLVVECDGASYHDPATDEVRDKAVEEMGHSVLRLTGSQIYRDPEGCVEAISEALANGASVKSRVVEEEGRLVLTPSQARAIRHGAGPARVAAPAGSGKTRVIQERVERLLRRGVPASRICAISFTNKAVEEMQKRLPDAADAGVRFTTLHALARQIAEQPPRGRKKELVERVRRARGKTRWSVLKPLLEPVEYYFSRSNDFWPDAISEYRRTHCVPTFADFPEKRRPTPERFLDIHADYETSLDEQGLTDFEGYVLDAVRVLAEDADFRAIESGRHDYWVVDEYQDLPPGKLALLRLLSSPGRNLFVVGDDDQVIYGFCGATPSVFSKFGDAFPDVAEYALEENWRCPHELVVRSLWMVERNRDRVDKIVRPQKLLLHDDVVQALAHEDYSGAGLRFVQNCVEEGRELQDIAVLFRLRDMAVPVESLLRSAGIPHVPCSHEFFFDKRVIRGFRAWLRTVDGSAGPEDYRRALELPTRYIRRGDLEFLERSPDLSGAVQDGPDEALTWLENWATTLRKTQQHAVREFSSLVRQVRKLRFPAAILQALGLRAAVDSEPISAGEVPATISYDVFHRLATQFESVIELEHWIRSRGHDKDYAIGDEYVVERVSPRKGKVALASIHQAKGTEFPAVAVLGPLDGMPDPRAIEREHREEERRIAYVAVTRAQERVLFCASRSYGAELQASLDGLTWDQYRQGLREPSAPPKPAAAPQRKRCPRCRSVYVGSERGECQKCPWIRLIPA